MSFMLEESSHFATLPRSQVQNKSTTTKCFMTLLSEVAKGELFLDEYVFLCQRRITRLSKKALLHLSKSAGNKTTFTVGN